MKTQPVDLEELRGVLSRIVHTSAALAERAHGCPHDPDSVRIFHAMWRASETLQSAMKAWVR